MNRDQLIAQVQKDKVIAIVRGIAPEQIVPTAKALSAGGIRWIEVTFNQSSPTGVEDTARAIAAIVANCPEIHVGAGTVMTMEQLDAAHAAGAQYIISPHVDKDLISRCVELGLLAMPGALTPTEIVAAYEMGAAFVKVFPAGSFGVDYIKAIRAPISHIPLLAVGGVDASNMAEYAKAGICGFGIGGKLVDKSLIEAGDFAGLTQRATQCVEVANSL